MVNTLERELAASVARQASGRLDEQCFKSSSCASVASFIISSS